MPLIPPTPEAIGMLAVAPLAGSFLAAWAVRLPLGRSIVLGRSACLHCGQVLSPRDLVPIVSWCLAGGRCRHCRGAISPFYPVVEMLAVAVAASVAAILPGTMLVAGCLFGWTLLMLAVIDWRTGLLPDRLTLPLLAAGCLVTLVSMPADLDDHLLGAAAGFFSFAAVTWLYRRIRRRDGLGLGDAKLLAAAGAWVGWQGLASVVLVASFTALLVTVTATRGKAVTLGHRLAFGPYLCGAAWLVWLSGPLRWAAA